MNSLDRDKDVSRNQPSDRRADALSVGLASALTGATVRYGKWRIYYDPPPIPNRSCDWQFVHDDFDASWEGEEDGYVSNGLSGSGASVEDCKAQIDDMEADRGAS